MNEISSANVMFVSGADRPRASRMVLLVGLLVVALLTALPNAATADGTETLGPPSIEIAAGNGVAVDVVGTRGSQQPADLQVEVPAGATVEQVLLYWNGTVREGQPVDTEITLDGTPVTGQVIGGPTYFFGSNPRIHSAAVRADITDLVALTPGSTTTLTVDGMNFDHENNGAGVIAVTDDGTGGTTSLVDGLDVAYANFSEPRRTTVPQTVNFAASAQDRTMRITTMVGSVGENRPHAVDVTVAGTTTRFENAIVDDGPEFGIADVAVTVPAGAESVTVELVSTDLGTDLNPASLEWVNLATALEPAGCVSGPLATSGSAETLGVHVVATALGIDESYAAHQVSVDPGPGSAQEGTEPQVIEVPDGNGGHLVRLELGEASAEVDAGDTSVTSTGFVQIVDLSVLNGEITADALTSRSQANATTASAHATTDGSRIEGLTIPGGPIEQEITFNTTIEVPELGTLTLYERSHETTPDYSAAASMTLFDLDLSLGELGDVQIVIGRTGATAAATNDPCIDDLIANVSAHATALDVSGPAPVSVAESGPIPSQGGDDLSALATVNVADQIEDATVFTSATGGIVDGVSHGDALAIVERLSLGGGEILAEAVKATTRTEFAAGAATTTASTELVGLEIGGTDVCAALALGPVCTPPPNTPFIPDNPLLTVTFNVQDDGTAESRMEGVGCAADAEQCTVQAIVIEITSVETTCESTPLGTLCLPSGTTTDTIIVSEAHSDAHAPLVIQS